MHFDHISLKHLSNVNEHKKDLLKKKTKKEKSLKNSESTTTFQVTNPTSKNQKLNITYSKNPIQTENLLKIFHNKIHILQRNAPNVLKFHTVPTEKKNTIFISTYR